MTEASSTDRPSGQGSAKQRFRLPGRLLFLLAALAGAGAIAQVVTSTSPPVYRTNSTTQIFSTMDQAEAVMRADPDFYGAGDQLEHFNTAEIRPGTLRLQYTVRDRRADTFYGPMYFGDAGIYGQGKHGCSVAPPDPKYATSGDWCGDETALITAVENKLRGIWSGCTINGTVTSESSEGYANPSLVGTLNPITHGEVRYLKLRLVKTTATCTSGATIRTHEWKISKRTTLYCRNGYQPIGMAVNEATLEQDNVCKARNGSVAWVEAPIQQCGGCAGSENPIYPATGEKQRHEEDFIFAGRSFSRHYRSLRQFRNNSRFAVGWNHTWSDRVITGQSTPYIHVDETGSYEGFALISGNRYRGENSTDQVLERVNTGGIGWRLRMSGGEVREFDLDGKLIAVRDPEEPLSDIVLAYANGVLATVTDAQGRALSFEYADNMLRRIHLPDGRSVAYDYDNHRNLTRVTYPGNAIRQYHYNEQGLAGDNQPNQLTGITAEDNRRYASFQYDARGRALSSRVLGIPNELTSISYPDEDSATLDTADGGARGYTIQPGMYRRVLAVQEGADSDRQTFDSLGRLESLTDKRNVRTEYGYTDAFRTLVISAVGTDEERREEFSHHPVSGLVTEQRTKDKAGTLVARMVWTYNSRHQVTSVAQIDPVTGASRLTSATHCEAADVTSGVCPVVGLVTSVDGPRPGAVDVVRYEYRPTDEVSCASSPSTCPYRKGDLWRTINSVGHVIENLRYDGAGRLLSMRDANGVLTDLVYDPRGRVVASKIRGSDDASETDDQITQVEYDPTGTVHRITLPDGASTTYEYDAGQRLTAIVDATGNRLSFTLNAAGERTGEHAYDPAGTLLRTLTATFDTLGRLERQVDAYQHGITFGYDKGDNLSLVTDALGRKTGHDYDALGRLRSTLQDVDGVAALTQYQYDALDQVTNVLDPNGLPTSYEYNGLGDLVRQQSQDTRTTRFSYDEAGNLLTRLDARGITATYAYDPLDRLASVSYPDSSRNVAYLYDGAPEACLPGERFAKGQLSRITDASGSTEYCYDRYGNTVRKLQTTQGRTYVVRYLHTDPRGNLPGSDTLSQNPPSGNQMIGMTYPDGSSLRIVRDPQGRPQELRVTLANGQAKVLLSGVSYYPFGPVRRWTFGNNRQLQRSHDLNYDPEFVLDPTSGGISEGYQFNEVGNLTALRRADHLNPARRSYDYDGLDRLTHVRDGATNTLLQGYGYDATGNRTWKSDQGVTTPYTLSPARHHLTQIGNQSRAYDSVGNTYRIDMTPNTGGGSDDGPPGGGGGGGGDPGPGPILPPPSETESMGVLSLAAAPANTREFEYDDSNRMRLVKHDGVVAMSYLYNGLDERVYRHGSGAAITTLYDESGKWIGDYDASGQPIQQAIWMDDLPVGLLVGAGAGQKLFYIEADVLGTPRVVIDPDRNVAVWRWDLASEAFGDSMPNEDVDGDGNVFVFDMRFPGQRYDSATGFNYNYYRDYDPTTGRYLQSDPIGLDGGISTYGYANGSPFLYVDNDGLVGTLILRFALRKMLPRLSTRMGGISALRYAERHGVRKAIARQVRSGKPATGSRSGQVACDPIKRSGPRGVDPGHHNANVLVRDANGKLVSHQRVVSGNMTPAEKALGFPKNTLASHTEARAVTHTPLGRGHTMTITGQRPPCTSCRGYMNRASADSGATIRYQWREGGRTHRWTTGPKG
ncbi:MAG: type IV secretion protein Rhs [Lysobacter sp.]|nr:type IV secretion protein Rhs [Lysobacter sp.]